jgi:hypothetical protein
MIFLISVQRGGHVQYKAIVHDICVEISGPRSYIRPALIGEHHISLSIVIFLDKVPSKSVNKKLVQSSTSRTPLT